MVLGAACAVERPDSAPEQRASPQGRKLAAAPKNGKQTVKMDGNWPMSVAESSLKEEKPALYQAIRRYETCGLSAIGNAQLSVQPMNALVDCAH